MRAWNVMVVAASFALMLHIALVESKPFSEARIDVVREKEGALKPQTAQDVNGGRVKREAAWDDDDPTRFINSRVLVQRVHDSADVRPITMADKVKEKKEEEWDKEKMNKIPASEGRENYREAETAVWMKDTEDEDYDSYGSGIRVKEEEGEESGMKRYVRGRRINRKDGKEVETRMEMILNGGRVKGEDGEEAGMKMIVEGGRVKRADGEEGGMKMILEGERVRREDGEEAGMKMIMEGGRVKRENGEEGGMKMILDGERVKRADGEEGGMKMILEGGRVKREDGEETGMKMKMILEGGRVKRADGDEAETPKLSLMERLKKFRDTMVKMMKKIFKSGQGGGEAATPGDATDAEQMDDGPESTY